MRIINKIGNESLLNREKSLFLCSKHAPYSLYDKVFGWVDSLTADDCVICFNSSELEDEVMRALLVNQVPTILVVMNRITDSIKHNMQIEKAMSEKRLLIIILQRDEPHGAGQTPRLRTQFMIQMAEHIVCGYVNKNGSIFPILAGMENVRNLEQENALMAAEPSEPPSHQRWKVWEDKILLRMFYEDMGLHAIKKRLHRTYISVRTRIRAITLPEEVLKGREFEDFVLELFDLNKTNAYSLLEWRASIPKYFSQPLFETEQITRYQEYATEKAQNVFIILGVGGEPSMPEELYLIPIDSILQIQSKPSLLKQFQREHVDKWFSIDEFVKHGDSHNLV